jgi:hypothetical protein
VLGESTLEAYLSRLAITLEGRAVGAVHVKHTEGQNSSQSSQANELLFSEIINTTEEPTICATEVQPEDESEPVQYLYVFWKTKVHLSKLNIVTYPITSLISPKAGLRPKYRSSAYTLLPLRPTNLWRLSKQTACMTTIYQVVSRKLSISFNHSPMILL